jgi:hypothetical protein
LRAGLLKSLSWSSPVIVCPLILSDPADDPVLYTAATGNAEILSTLNVRHFAATRVQQFCSEHGIRILTDVEVLQELLPAKGTRPPDETH